jgi:hypothetical protein
MDIHSKETKHTTHEKIAGGRVARMGEKRNAYRILVGKPDGKRPLGRPRRSWVDISKWIIERLDGMVWIGFIGLRIGTSGELL